MFSRIGSRPGFGWPRGPTTAPFGIGRTGTAVVLALVFTLLAIACPRPSFAVADVEPRFVEALVAVAKEAIRRDRFDTAATFLEHAIELEEDPWLIKALGHCYRELERWDDAARMYRRYLELLPDAKDRSSVVALIDEMERNAVEAVSLVSIETDPPGAAIHLDALDSDPVGTSPITMEISTGTHTLYAVLARYETVEHQLTVAPGTRHSFSWNLEPVGGEPIGTEPIVKVGVIDGGGPTDWAAVSGWLLSGAGGAALLSAVILMVDSADLEKRAATCKREESCSRDQHHGLLVDASTEEDAAVILFAGGGAVLVTGLALLLFLSEDDPDPEEIGGIEVSFGIGADRLEVGLSFDF